MTRHSRLRPVHDFIAACQKLSTDTRARVIREVSDFCAAHREGKAVYWPELLALDTEKVLGDASGATMVATMNYMHILPGHRNRVRS